MPLDPGIRRDPGGRVKDTADVFAHMLETYETGELVSSCAWCGRVEVDGTWERTNRLAIAAVDGPATLSHSICPECAARQRSAGQSR